MRQGTSACSMALSASRLDKRPFRLQACRASRHCLCWHVIAITHVYISTIFV